MTDELPECYPQANATKARIEQWLAAADPPYDEMRAALPWLTEQRQLEWWVEGYREAMQIPNIAAVARLFSLPEALVTSRQ